MLAVNRDVALALTLTFMVSCESRGGADASARAPELTIRNISYDQRAVSAQVAIEPLTGVKLDRRMVPHINLVVSALRRCSDPVELPLTVTDYVSGPEEQHLLRLKQGESYSQEIRLVLFYDSDGPACIEFDLEYYPSELDLQHGKPLGKLHIRASR